MIIGVMTARATVTGQITSNYNHNVRNTESTKFSLSPLLPKRDCTKSAPLLPAVR
jgi:hypothetical protein